MIYKLPAYLFLLSLAPFFLLSTSIFGLVPDFYRSELFADIVFLGFHLAAAFAALGFVVIIANIIED